MAFSFTIPSSSIDAGIPSVSRTIQLDRGARRDTQPRVKTASFGDGYEQRVVNGLNPRDDSFPVAFVNRSADEINLIDAYFNSMIGKSFILTVTELSGDKNIRVVCDSWDITYIHRDYHSMSARFRRVYEPDD